LVALGALTRGNGIFLAVPVGLMVWTGRPRLGWPALRAPLTMLAGLIVVLIPWTVRNASALHSFVPLTTETGYTLAGAFNPQAATRKDFPYLWTPPASEITAAVKQEPEGNEAQISDRLQSSTLHYMGRHPGQVIKTLGWNVLRLFSLTGPHLERWGAPYQSYPRGLAVTSVYTFWLLAVLAIAGLFLAGAGDVPWSLWGCPLAILLGTLPIAATERMRIPADPFFILLAAGALAAVWRRGRIGSRPWNSSPTASGSSAASPGMPSTSTSSRTS
jgi:hypothetical protein